MATNPKRLRVWSELASDEIAELDRLAKENARSRSQELRFAAIEHLRRARRRKPK